MAAAASKVRVDVTAIVSTMTIAATWLALSACGGQAGSQPELTRGKADNEIYLPFVCNRADPWPSNWAAFEDAVLALVNAHRQAGARCDQTWYGPRAPLQMNAELRQAARLHSEDMAENHYFSHTSLDGRSPWDRIDDAGYTGNASGENIAAGYGSAEAAVAGWMNSPGHCANIMRSCGSGCVDEIGIGYVHDSQSDWGTYWTQDFGWRPTSITSTTSSAPATVSGDAAAFYTTPLIDGQ